MADCLTKDMKCYRQGMKKNRQNWNSPLRHAGSSLRSMTRIQTGRRNFWHYYLNFIGKVELPAQELTEEELAEIKEKQRLRERNAMYQRRRRAKFMPKTKAIRAKVQEAEIKETLENASAKAENCLWQIMMHISQRLLQGKTKYMLIPGFSQQQNEGIWQTGYKETRQRGKVKIILMTIPYRQL